MNRRSRSLSLLAIGALTLATMSVVGSSGRVAGAVPDDAATAVNRLEADASGDLRIVRSAAGVVTFVGTTAGGSVDNPGVSPSTSIADAARAHLDRYGAALGATQPGTALVQYRATPTLSGLATVRYRQTVRGLPVIGGDVVVTLTADRELASMLSTMSRHTKVAAARVSQSRAAQAAKAALKGRADVTATSEGRWLLDPTVLRTGADRSAHTVWRFEVRRGEGVRRLVLVDDQTGAVLMNLNLIQEIDRVVCNRNNVGAADFIACNSGFAREEGDGPVGEVDVNRAYDYGGAVSSFYTAIGGPDLTNLLGIDVGGVPKLAQTVQWCFIGDCPMENAFWNGLQTYYGDGWVTDDVVGHEMTHGVIDRYSELFYWGQSGAINESIADIMGEIVDQRNVADAPAAAWLVGEDLPDGAIRDMQNPPTFGDPDRTQSPNYWVEGFPYPDNNGVHFNSGVSNKTAYLISQGGSFNGQTITGIDGANVNLTKTGKLYLLVLQSLSSGSGFSDLGLVLDQACNTLRGLASSGFTAANCTNVHKAGLATQLAITPANARQPANAPSTCSRGFGKRVLFASESGNAAAKFATGATAWTRTDDPFWGSNANSGTVSWRNSAEEDAFTAIPMTPHTEPMPTASAITLPTGQRSYLHFQSWTLLDFEPGIYYDGGLVEVDNVGDAAPPVDVANRPWINGPSRVLHTGFSNPSANRRAFAGDSLGWVASRLDLTSFAGKTIRPRFVASYDNSVLYLGWFVDDITVYTCDRLKVVAGSVKIKGKAEVGTKLKAKLKNWTPADLKFKYKWYRDGTKIKGAKAKKYQLTNEDLGHKISVKVKGKKPNHVSASAKSKKTDKVKR